MSSTQIPANPGVGLSVPSTAAGLEALVARLAEEMSEAWRQGQRPRAEEFLDRYPRLWNHAPAVMDLVHEEVSLRREQGETVDSEEFAQRFPKWKQQIEILLHCIQALQAPAEMPRVGQAFGDFQLLAELGRGGQGRVFVATQTSLGGRPVVLKITPCKGDEHLSLARLQHTHIMPLLSALDEPGQNRRVLCMPYLGGLTLAAVLEAFQDRPVNQRTGKQILEVLDAARVAGPVELPPDRDPGRPFLLRASYVQAIGWMGACLAEALKYAHDRGLLHLDLKPSNVLLTANCQPLLLDFHLAREPLHPGDSGINFGGTPGYMSPEQHRVMAAIKRGETVEEAIDGRCDIHSLGLVLLEALGGKKKGGDVRPTFPTGIPTGLADIIAKCLSPNAQTRYQDAGSLAADLWAHLNDMPLKGVANRSMAERWRKWRRRRPHLLSLLGMLAALLVVSVAALSMAVTYGSRRVDEARAALADGRNLLKKGRHAEASNTLKHGLALLEHLPGNQDLRQKLLDRLHQASQSQLAHQLHEITDRFRLLYGVDSVLAAKLEDLQASCQGFWEKREWILDRLGKQLEPEVDQQVRFDLLDLAILGADLRVRLAKKNKTADARREALQALAEAEALFGPNAVLYHERQKHAEAIGRADLAREASRRASEQPPRTAWEFYAVGRSLMNAGQLEAAAQHFDRATAIQPTGLWPNFYQGICSYRLGRFEDAALAFTVCVTLSPNTAGCFHNRALAFVGLGRTERALADFDRALQLDPTCAEIALNRGLLHFREQRLTRAAQDLDLALALGVPPARAQFHLAQVCLAQQDLPGALSHLEQCLQSDPQHAEAAELMLKLQKDS